MIFDIRTPDSAFSFVLEFLQISSRDFINNYFVVCSGDFEVFCETYSHAIFKNNFENIDILAFHITSNDDNCSEIQTHGLRNLQYVLTEPTKINKLLKTQNIIFDIGNKTLYIGNNAFSIDYDRYLAKDDLNHQENLIKKIAHKVFFDYQVSCFLSLTDVKGYLTRIDKRPEFFMNLTEFYPKASIIEEKWINSCKGYVITFIARFNQFAWYTFYDEKDDYSSDDKRYKFIKWVLSNAISRSFEGIGSSSEIFAYINPNKFISPDQIIGYKEII